MPRSPTTPSLPLCPIAAALAAALSLAPCEALATKTVLNCDDHGPGSLRQAILDAGEGELVDATSLAPCTISLTTGFLTVLQNAITVDGPGADKLTIDGADDFAGSGHHYPVFFHFGSGTLEIDHATISHGDFYFNDPSHPTKYRGGGCIFSLGNVTLKQSIVSNCTMTAGPQAHARGGAIAAYGDVTLMQSVATGNSVHGASPYGSEISTYGGAIAARRTTKLDHSTVSGNHALNGGGIFSKSQIDVYSSTISGNDAQLGGGIQCNCILHVSDSTIARNHAELSGALYLVYNMTPAGASFIRNSTITGNVIDATFSAAAMEVGVPITISNSTIAFNFAPNNTVEGALYSLGGTLTLESSIVSGNTPGDVDVQSGTVVNGANNLSPASLATMPGDTKKDCPLLEPLAWNGGPTQTLALRHTSPAINTGNNLLGVTTDQRGAGFPRPFQAVADIGAWEWQGGLVDDSISHDGFDIVGSCRE